ncbi:MAG: PQQ-binding-like beta-propeller repeat protein, partial [Opitutales bacterium]|nr:PQQ-binding-like beta-propeller repeat protein [Opitutales bacterium]
MMFNIKPAIILTLALPFALVSEHDWPQWRGPERDGVWRESGIRTDLDLDSEGSIKLKWSVDIAAGYSQPTVADGRVYVTDRLDDAEEIERVHCFDFETGKQLWAHQ